MVEKTAKGGGTGTIEELEAENARLRRDNELLTHGRSEYERGLREGQTRIPTDAQAQYDAQMSGLEAAIAARPIPPETVYILERSDKRPRGIAIFALSKTLGLRLVAFRLPAWVPVGSAVAEGPWNAEELERINRAIDSKIPESDRPAIAALRDPNQSGYWNFSLSRERALAIEGELTKYRKQEIYQGQRLPLLQLVGKSFDEVRRLVSYLVELQPGQQVPAWHSSGAEPPDDIPRLPPRPIPVPAPAASASPTGYPELAPQPQGERTVIAEIGGVKR